MPKGSVPQAEREKSLQVLQEAGLLQAYQGDYTMCSMPGTFPFAV